MISELHVSAKQIEQWSEYPLKVYTDKFLCKVIFEFLRACGIILSSDSKAATYVIVRIRYK